MAIAHGHRCSGIVLISFGVDMDILEQSKKTGILAAAEFLKYSVAFATGSLVFSAGLVGEKIALPSLATNFLIAAWVLLTLSVVFGVAAYSRIPIQLAEQNYNIEDRYFIIPGRAHQVFFLLGVISLGLSLVLTIKLPTEYNILNARQAADRAAHQLPTNTVLKKVEKVELLKGLEDSKKSAPVWHVQVELKASENGVKQGRLVKAAANIPTITCDYFIDAKTGDILRLP